VPLVDVTHDRTISDRNLERLRDLLPDLVARAVECPEEPWTGPARAGDIEIRFRTKTEHDIGELQVVIEVRTRRLASRADDPQRRADLIRDGLAGLGLGPVGVWLILVEGAWSQT
jgi:hypothetical protein